MDEMLNVVLVEVLKFAVVAAVGLSVPILIQVLRRAGLQLSADREAQVNQIALLAAAEVEEWAAKRLKANLSVESGDKMDRALKTMAEKIPGLNEVDAKRAISAALPQIGLGAAAGLREVGKALAQECKCPKPL